MAIWNERIHERRTEKGITLAQIADKLGVTEATAQRYESGNIKSIPYEHMCAYGEILNCSPAYLMGWSDSVEGIKNKGNYKVYIDIPASNEDEAIFIAIKGMLQATGFEERANSITKKEALELYKFLNFDEVLTLEKFELMQFNKIKKYYNELNDIGKHEATKRVEELTLVPRYVKENTTYVNAAHADDYAGAPEELKRLEEDIMDDDNF